MTEQERDKEIRDLDVSEYEGEDVKGGAGIDPPEPDRPGKPSFKSPVTVSPKEPNRKLPPGR